MCAWRAHAPASCASPRAPCYRARSACAADGGAARPRAVRAAKRRERGSPGGSTRARRERSGEARGAKNAAVEQLSPAEDAAVDERTAAATRLTAAEGTVSQEHARRAARSAQDARNAASLTRVARCEKSTRPSQRSVRLRSRASTCLRSAGAAPRRSANARCDASRCTAPRENLPRCSYPRSAPTLAAVAEGRANDNARTTTTTPATMTAMAAMTEEHEHGAQSSNHAARSSVHSTLGTRSHGRAVCAQPSTELAGHGRSVLEGEHSDDLSEAARV